MDERERMREALATRGMGWKLCYRGKYPLWESQHNQARVLCSSWHPDTDWAQCGLVIEAMREKGWRAEILMARVGYHARFYRTGEIERYDAQGKTFPEAVALAAFRALEAPNGQT